MAQGRGVWCWGEWNLGGCCWDAEQGSKTPREAAGCWGDPWVLASKSGLAGLHWCTLRSRRPGAGLQCERPQGHPPQ